MTQLGLSGISRSAVSRLCSGLDEQVKLFRERPLEGRYPYLWLDAKVERVREPGGVRSKALVIAYGVHESGRREVIGIDVGEAETEAFWREFLRGLRARGLAGVALCVSDAHEGLKAAIAKVLGCPWQRCTVHFLRDMLGHCTKAQQPMIATAIRQIFASESAAEAHERLAGVAGALQGSAPKVARLLLDAEEELLAFMSFPAEHWSKLRSTNPLERVNREVGREATWSASTPTTPPSSAWRAPSSSSRTTSGSWVGATSRSSRWRPCLGSAIARRRGRWRRYRRPEPAPTPTMELHHNSGLDPRGLVQLQLPPAQGLNSRRKAGRSLLPLASIANCSHLRKSCLEDRDSPDSRIGRPGHSASGGRPATTRTHTSHANMCGRKKCRM